MRQRDSNIQNIWSNGDLQKNNSFKTYLDDLLGLQTTDLTSLLAIVDLTVVIAVQPTSQSSVKHIWSTTIANGFARMSAIQRIKPALRAWINQELQRTVQTIKAAKTMQKWSLMSGDYIKLITFIKLVIGRRCKMNERGTVWSASNSAAVVWLVKEQCLL